MGGQSGVKEGTLGGQSGVKEEIWEAIGQNHVKIEKKRNKLEVRKENREEDEKYSISKILS